MTIGIYKLNFNDTDKVYVGQSTHIEIRIIQHLSKLRTRKAAYKLQLAHDRYGLIGYDILVECTNDELASYEKEAIKVFDSFNNGFNSTPDTVGSNCRGENNPNALHARQKYMEVLSLLVQDSVSLSKQQISDLTGVSINIIRHIMSLESHGWLKEEMPAEYEILEDRKAVGNFRNKQYPDIVSPSGQVYEINHITNFAKEHGLLQPKLTEVLKGTRNQHKGWTRLRH